jgi:[acyl-carrier-protein] S-malonyltransferase
MDSGMNKIAFCFPGQGSLEAGMGRDIAENEPAAMQILDEGSEAAGLDLRRLCFEAPLEELVDTAIQQPALVTTSLAVLAVLRERGIEPDYVIGHSVGEFAALAAAEAIGIPEAIALVRERGLAMAEAAREHPGSMAAILGLEDEVVEEICREIQRVWPANYNCPGQLVVSAGRRNWKVLAGRSSSRSRVRSTARSSGRRPSGSGPRSTRSGSASRSRPSCPP